VYDQSKEVAFWTAASAEANFEPKLGKTRTYQLDRFYPDECEHALMMAMNHLDNLEEAPGYRQLPTMQQRAISDFPNGTVRLTIRPTISRVTLSNFSAWLRKAKKLSEFGR
jgi:hypothetical protein